MHTTWQLTTATDANQPKTISTLIIMINFIFIFIPMILTIPRAFGRVQICIFWNAGFQKYSNEISNIVGRPLEFGRCK